MRHFKHVGFGNGDNDAFEATNAALTQQRLLRRTKREQVVRFSLFVSAAMKNSSEDTRCTAHTPISFGAQTIGSALCDTIVYPGLHEIYAAKQAYFGAATGFAAVLALSAAEARVIFWIRQDFLDTETGVLNASGFAELGLDVARIILVKARDAEGVLRAGEQAARCAALGAVVMEIWGEPKILDFTASRRLSLAASKSKVPIFMLRAAAKPSQSAASTRWSIRSAPSRALEANAPGFPAFDVTLLRHRGGMTGSHWWVEWSRDQRCFHELRRDVPASVSRVMVPISDDRSAAASAYKHEWRRAG